MSYKIKQIYIENFKLITTKGILLTDFFNNDFIVLDGPNGFGKTTVFDAVEIALTGKIHRIISNHIVPGNQGADDVLYLNDQSSPLKIVVEFVNISDEDSKIIYVYGKAGHTLGKSAKKANSQSYFERFELEEFEDYLKEISDLRSINQTEIDVWLNYTDRFYNLYHYVQQEESTFFLKLREDTRMDSLGKLFDTEKEEIELRKIKDLLDEVIRQINILTSLKSQNLKQIESVEKLNEDDSGSIIEYNNIFEFLNYPPVWDNARLSGLGEINTDGLTKRDLYKKEVITLIEFVMGFNTNYQDFLKVKKNNEIDSRIENRDNLILILLVYNFIENIGEIRTEYSKISSISNFQNLIKKEGLLKNIENIDFPELFEDFEYENSKTFLEKVKGIVVLKEEESNLDEIIRDFTETRENIISLFKKIHDDDNNIDLGESECPLCGFEWEEGYEQLLSEMVLKGDKIEKIKSATSIKIQEEYELFYEEFVIGLNDDISKYLEIPENIINKEYFEEINIDSKREEEIFEFIEWLRIEEIDISDIVYTQLNIFPTDLDIREEKLIQKLKAKKQTITEDFDFNRFASLFDTFLENDEKNIEELTVKKLKAKIQYIDQQFFKGNSEYVSKLAKDNKFIEIEQLPKLDEVRRRLQKLNDIYLKSIKDHRKQIAKNIELPFFIISSKILQSFEYGSGIFIKWDITNRTDNLKFTQGSKTSHDALYSMSSGQLSALIISFTLAMNKVFDKSNFGVLLIDDPTQTMDEINMSSLVELMRNEFSEKQIILSTHEDEISHFMRFKFNEFNLSTKSINMKDKQFIESQL